MSSRDSHAHGKRGTWHPRSQPVVSLPVPVTISLMLSNDDLNQRLVDQYTEIVRLAGGLAHEIKNPLSTIRMNMELLAEDFRESDAPRDRRAMKKIDLVQRECQRLQDLLDNFLQFAKAHRLNLQPSDLNALVRQVLDFYRPQGAAGRRRDRRLSDRQSAHGAAGPRGVPRGVVEPAAQRRAGDARWRATGGAHLRHGQRRGPGSDRHRLRHGRSRRGPRSSRRSSRRSAAARASDCPPRGRSSKATAARSPCKASPAEARK